MVIGELSVQDWGENKQGSFCGPAEASGAIPREDRRGARDGHRARSVFWDKVFGSRFQRLSGKGEVLAPPGAGILMICFPWQHTEKPSSLQLHCSCSLAKFLHFWYRIIPASWHHKEYKKMIKFLYHTFMQEKLQMYHIYFWWFPRKYAERNTSDRPIYFYIARDSCYNNTGNQDDTQNREQYFWIMLNPTLSR